MNQYLKSLLTCSACFALGPPVVFAANPSQYSNIFLSYVTPTNVIDTVDYTVKTGLNGLIVWEFRNDTPYDDSEHSLLYAAKSEYEKQGHTNPFIMGYYSVFSAYSHYPVPGSKNEIGQTLDNKDFTQKLQGMSAIVYAFLIGKNDGCITFNDEDAAVKLNNFKAFAALKNGSPNTALYFSIGGADNPASFETVFGNPEKSKNFITSVLDFINGKYSDGLAFDGVDLDYENLTTTTTQAKQYLELITALKTALPKDKKLSVTLVSIPALLQGKDDLGYGCATFKSIVDIADHVNLMTYSYHGSFDVNPKHPPITGLQSNLSLAYGDPIQDDPSIMSSVSACPLTPQQLAKVSVGIPAYAHALSNIPSTNGGLFQMIPKNALIPKGDLDQPECIVAIAPALADNNCSGIFSYKNVVTHLLTHGFTQTIRYSGQLPAPGTSSGTTAFANTWHVPDPILLQTTNIGSVKKRDLGITISLSQQGTLQFGPSDYIAPQAAIQYSNLTPMNTNYLAADVPTQVSWATYAGGPKGVCPKSFVLKPGKKHWNIKVKIDSAGHVMCHDKQW